VLDSAHPETTPLTRFRRGVRNSNPKYMQYAKI
jgi:hypothetical protein